MRPQPRTCVVPARPDRAGSDAERMNQQPGAFVARRDLIVIGASAGGVEAVSVLVAQLPADLPAAVCVVVHQPAYQVSRLTEVLARAGALPAVTATQGMPLRPGTIHVAPRDLHLLVEDGHLRLVHGPKENRVRPAVDPLFRSAALAFGPRVIGVVLSGALDDGTAGLWAIRDRGGIAVVQDPADALVSSMPASALAEVGADYVAPVDTLGRLIDQLTRQDIDPALFAAAPTESVAQLEREVAIARIDEEAHQQAERYGVPSRFGCPDCGGVLWDTRGDRGPMRFRCETGHAYSAGSLAEMQADAVERALWAALRALEDKTELARARAELAKSRRLETLARQLEVQVQATQEHAAVVRTVIRQGGRAGMGMTPALLDVPPPTRRGRRPERRTRTGT